MTRTSTPTPQPAPEPAASMPRLPDDLSDIETAKAACAQFREVYTALRKEIAKVIVGQFTIVEETLTALFANGHVLLEGVPGLGKTLLVTTLSRVLSLPFARIQFTPDLMPADITGTSIVIEDTKTGRREFTFRPGPLFHQLVLADEINRATPKSQAALLEAMQERSVTAGGETRHLTKPFFVMATQNPIEQEGTYPLPEAQLDRFIFKTTVPYATQKEMNAIVHRTTRNVRAEIQPIIDGEYILQAQELVRKVIVAPPVQDYIIRLVLATHPGGEYCPEKIAKYINVGVSPRGAQALTMAAKVRALVDGRYAVAFRDVHTIALPALRHRIVRTFEAETDGVSSDRMIREIVHALPRDDSPRSATEDHGVRQEGIS